MIDTFNRPFLSCLKPLLQREAKCEANTMDMIFLFTWPVEKDVFSVTDTGGLEEKIRVLPLTVEPMTFWPQLFG